MNHLVDTFECLCFLVLWNPPPLYSLAHYWSSRSPIFVIYVTGLPGGVLGFELLEEVHE